MTFPPDAHRILLEARLRPLQGERFQPTDFPDIGAAEFLSAMGSTHLLVESAQSTANHLEKAIWDPVASDLIEPMRGLPYVRLRHKDLGLMTSLTEPHRLASPYFLPLIADQLKAELGWNGKRLLAMHELAGVVLKHDPGSLLHGVFFISMKPGNQKLPRLLSGFIEAKDVRQVQSGGVRFDHNDPSGPAKEGKGHVPYDRAEYASSEIVAYFNLDLVQLRSYGLSPQAADFLVHLALYKIRRFLNRGLRLRTACDLEMVSLTATRPGDFVVPEEDELETKLRGAIGALTASGEFASPAIWELEA